MPDFYNDDHRTLQDRFDSRALADTLEFATVKPLIDDAAKTFIEARAFFFLSTVNADGHPTVSHKGGAPGFVRVVDPTTIVFPSYDGNGMFLSMGNIANNGRIGLLFIDFNTPTGSAPTRTPCSSTRTAPRQLPGRRPGRRADDHRDVRELPPLHHQAGVRRAGTHVPDANGQAPLAEWKKIDLLQDVLPARFQNLAESEGGTISIEQYNDKVLKGET